MSYWDTSAFVKLYVNEPDSARFEELALTSPVVIGVVGHREMRTVFFRREAESVIPAGAAEALYRRFLADVAGGVVRLEPDSEHSERAFSEVLETSYRHQPPIFLRTNDALHLAAAKAAGETEFVTADFRQRSAAELLGFKDPQKADVAENT